MDDIIRRYYDKKIKCPICNTMVVETFLTPPIPIPNIPYRDIVNVAVCGECGWRGVVDKLRG